MERIFSKTKLEERTWAKLVVLDTLHWFCDRPEPTVAARPYNVQVYQRKSVKPRKLILALTFLNSILMHKPRLLLNLSPLRVQRIYLLMMQLLAMKSQLLLKTKPSLSSVMPINLRVFKRMLKTPPPPLINNLFFWGGGIVTIW